MPFFVQTVQLHCDSRSRSTPARKLTRPQWQPPSRCSSIICTPKNRPFPGFSRAVRAPSSRARVAGATGRQTRREPVDITDQRDHSPNLGLLHLCIQQPSGSLSRSPASWIGPYRADLVRVIHGDANPAGPGIKLEHVAECNEYSRIRSESSTRQFRG